MALLDGKRDTRAERQSSSTAASLTVVDFSSDRSTRAGLTWRQRYGRYLAVTDLLIVLWASAGAHLVQLSISSDRNPFRLSSLATSAAIVLLWLLVLSIFDTRDSKVIGFGSDEYKRVLNATLVVFGLVAMVSYLFQLNLPRGYLLAVLPAGAGGLVIGRWLWRRWLHQQRDRAGFVTNVLAVGNADTVRDLITELRRSPRAGYRVVGACISGGSPAATAAGRAIGSDAKLLGVPILGSLDQVVSAVWLTGADAVAITATAAFGPTAVRKLSWELEKTRAELILAPALTDIAGPRIHTHPVAGLPLIHVERATYSGPTRIIKIAFDLFGASLLLLLLSPVMLGLSIAIKVTSPGPVFFRQERVGVDGTRFRMIKFRSMRVNAEALVEQLRAQQATDAGNSILFKIKNDPRITGVGKFIRRYSLDEIPQLFNVLRMEMSLVGPRPPLAAEVAQYEADVHRRLLVKPGMTGLWQVSGRSDLDWDETVRLDLSYVENWSVTGDLVILLKTVRAVMSSSGAY